MTCITKTTNDGWRLESKLCQRHPLGIIKTRRRTEICKYIEIQKGLWAQFYSKRMSQARSKKLLVYLTHLRVFNHCFRLSHFPKSWKEVKVITLPKSTNNPKFSQNLSSISLLSTTSNLFEKFVLKIFQRRNEERGLLNASQFSFRVRHSTTRQCMRLTDHVTLYFNNNISTTAVFMISKKPVIQHHTLVCYTNYLT
jgi:hypothetical protein